MKTGQWFVWVASLALVVTAGLEMAGCSDSDGPASSAGQSCARTSDCGKSLVCVDNRCAPANTAVDGGVATGPALGAAGESCTRRADCQAGLSCLLQRCTGQLAGNDGGAPLGPRLGKRGESCVLASDCGDSLTCVPRSGGGVCDYENFGFMPTGNVCGAECKVPADCCQLPTGLTARSGALESCSDVRAAISGDPATACTGAVSFANEAPCFYLATYCNCAANTWSCEAGRCAYTAPCTESSPVPGGCPARSRTGLPLSSACNFALGTCGSSAARACADDASCVGLAVADDPSDACSAGECKCVQSRCYRQCDSILDCAAGFTCDAQASKVCVAGAKCTRNEQCATAARDVRAVCKAGECVMPCASDRECSPTGGTGGAFSGLVCSARGVCESLGCASDEECSSSNGLRTFCTPAPAASSSVPYASAVAN